MDCSTPGLPVHHQLPSLLKLMSIESVMPSHHLILCHLLLLLPSIFPSIRVFSNESAVHIRWPKYWRFSFNISPSNEHSGLISFGMDWLDLLVVQGTLTSLLQHHSWKASILQRSAFFIVQLSHPYMTIWKTIALPRQTFLGKVMSLLLNMLSRLVIAFLLRSKHLLTSWLQSPIAVILEPRKIKSATVSPSIYHEVMGPDAMILVFWMLSFWMMSWTQPCPSTENWIKDLLSMAPPIRRRSSFPLSQSLPPGSFHKPLSFSIRGKIEWKPQSQKLANRITWTTTLSNSMKLWAIPFRATQDNGSWWRVLTKCHPLEKGMANHFSILALRSPWTVWKSKKVWHWKMNSQVDRCPICYWRRVEK